MKEIQTNKLIERYKLNRATLAYWRGVGTVPELPAATWGILREGKHWRRIGRTITYTASGEKVVRRMAKATRMPVD